MDPLRIYLIYDPGSHQQGKLWTLWLSQTLSGLGMQRDEGRFGIPVFERSAPWGQAQAAPLNANHHPRQIDLAQATSNCILLLIDSRMHAKAAQWQPYIDHLRTQIEARSHRDVLIPVMLGPASSPLAGGTQVISQVPPNVMAPEATAARTRLLMRLLNAILVHRQAPSKRSTHRPGHGIFVSHARRDGLLIARKIVQALTLAGAGERPSFFLDTDSLVPGSDYAQRFEEAIGNGSLLALVTDAYHTRPWCRWEVLTAKRLGRPIVVADLCKQRVERTVPYLGNVPTEKLSVADPENPESLSDENIERLAVALLSEALRFELWTEHAQRRIKGKPWHLMARPPELADLAGRTGASEPRCVVYPDPPLGHEELELLQRAFPQHACYSISQALARP